MPIAIGTSATAPLVIAFCRLLTASPPGPMDPINITASAAAAMSPPA